MIAFATFFLGLVAGVHEVELLVGAEVVAVELRLDHETVARLDRPPWRARIDLGDRVEPRHLAAVAFGAAGDEVGRAEQWINLPRPLAEATWVLDLSPDGRGGRAQLGWQSLVDSDPTEVVVLLDGAELEVSDPRSFVLPAYDPNQLHLLRAELEFEENLSAVAEATFGGFFADEVSSKLTAVPLRIDGPDPPLEALQAAALSRGNTVRVVALERSPADVVVVRDARARRELARLAVDTRVATSFGRESRVRFLVPTPEVREGRHGAHLLFPQTSDGTVDPDQLVRVLLRSNWGGSSPAHQRLADAVSVAGLVASERNRPRAVVVLLGSPAADPSQLRPADVRHYLRTIGVPLFVWSTRRAAWSAAEGAVAGGAASAEGWGEIVDVSTPMRLLRAVREVREELSRQAVLWVEGIHLPQWIELRPPPPGVELSR
jgi:hypothetical protein